MKGEKTLYDWGKGFCKKTSGLSFLLCFSKHDSKDGKLNRKVIRTGKRGLGSSPTSIFPQTAGGGKYRTQRPWLPCALLANLLLIDIIRGCDYNKKWRFIRFHMKEKSMGYLSILETSKKWGVSKRRIQILCAEDRIPGATRIGNYWAIPDDAEKPKDARIKSGRYIKQKKSAE